MKSSIVSEVFGSLQKQTTQSHTVFKQHTRLFTKRKGKLVFCNLRTHEKWQPQKTVVLLGIAGFSWHDC